MDERVINLVKKYNLTIAQGIRYNEDEKQYEVGYGLDSPETYELLVADMDFIDLNIGIETFCKEGFKYLQSMLNSGN